MQAVSSGEIVTVVELAPDVGSRSASARSEAVTPVRAFVATDDVVHRLRRGAGWVVLTRLLGVTVTVLLNVVLARSLSPPDFGTFIMLTSVVAFLSFPCMLGLSGAVVRIVPASVAEGAPRRARRLLAATYWLVLAATLGVTVTLLGGWHLLGARFSLPAGPIPILLAANLALLAFMQLTSESLRGLHELRFASVMSGGQTGGLLSNVVLLTLLTSIFALARPSLTLAMSLNVASLSVVLPVGLFVLRRRVHFELNGGTDAGHLSTATLLATSLPFMVIQVVSFASSQADLWIAGAMCPESLPLYGAARRLMLIVAIPLQMVNFLVMASVAELNAQGRLKEMEKLLRRAATMAAVPSLAALAVTLMMGGTILELLFGAYYRDAATLLALLSLGQFALAWSGSSQCALTMTGRQNVAMAVNLSAALLLAAIGTLSAGRFGAIGLAGTSAAIVTVESLTQWLLARNLVGVRANMSFDFSAAAGLAAQVSAALPARLGRWNKCRSNARGPEGTNG